jgi:hypothetical protein
MRGSIASMFDPLPHALSVSVCVCVRVCVCVCVSLSHALFYIGSLSHKQWLPLCPFVCSVRMPMSQRLHTAHLRRTF